MPSINKPLSAPRQAFVQYYADSGSMAYNNASEAYKMAYPKCNGGWNRLGHRLMTNDDITKAIKAYKQKITAEMEHNRAIAIKQLTENITALDAIILKQPMNVAAITARTGVTRELNAISNLHKATVVTEAVPDQPTGAEAEATEAAATEYKLRLARTGS